MTWIQLPDADDGSGASPLRLTELGAIRLAAGPVPAQVASLCAPEQELVAGASPRRQRQFAAGRSLARAAMAALGVPPQAIGRGAAGAPLWPAGLVGSITHSGGLAAAAVAAARHCGGIGIDLEDPARVAARLHPRLFTASEQRLLSGADPRLPGLLFAAKEATYKAVQPRVGRYIGFQEAEVDVDWAAGAWRPRYLGEHEPNRLMERGRGRFGFWGSYVIALLTLPAGSADPE